MDVLYWRRYGKGCCPDWLNAWLSLTREMHYDTPPGVGCAYYMYST